MESSGALYDVFLCENYSLETQAIQCWFEHNYLMVEEKGM